ncbi:MAG: domain S-box protein [Myxococcaceae bacterium]|jgi:PAS domain S-box-containing protein|nr:domain S-box protein [Myxococcaceae bacterium]MEA2750619.1 two-component system, cell cycle sensor histidine kinase and response regulator CckA [Myxococcales bacterium]
MSTERDAAAAQALLRAIVGGSADAIFVKDREGRYVLCNEATEQLLGLPFADIVGHTDHDFLAPEYADAIVAQDKRVIETGAAATIEERLLIKGPARTFLTTKFPYRAADGTIEGVVGVARDVTDRARAAEQMRQSETLLRLVLDALPVGVTVVDPDGDVVLGNRAAEQIWGETIVRGTERWRRSRGWSHATGEPIQPHEWASVRALFEGVPHLDQVIDIESIDGSTRRIIRNSAVPIREPTGFQGAVIVNEDVTDRVRLEEGLAQARKIEAIGQLAGSVAHDFNNLLTIIMSYVDILGAGFEAGDPRCDDLAEIQKAADSAAALTRQLLAFGRREVAQPQNVRLEAVVAGVEKMLARLIGEHIHIRTDFAAAGNIVRIDPFQVEQIVLNLAVNARDAMPDGGDVTITTKTIEDSTGRFARLEVSDTGVGMDAPTRARAFEPFFTTKERGRGTGLGLSTVSGIVQQNGGRIRVASEPGRGTTFEIDLPIATASPTAEALPVEAATSRGTEEILLVEDSAPVRLAVRAILERYGYRVHDVGDASAALAYIAEDDTSVDLVLIDVVLPSMHGHQLAAAIVAKRPRVRVLYMTGYADEEMPRSGPPASGSRVLVKPFTADVLARAVRDVLGDARAR